VFQKSVVFPNSSCTLTDREEATEEIKGMETAGGMVLPCSRAGGVAA